MPAYVSAPDVIKAAIIQSMAGQQIINVLHFRSPVSITSVILDEVALGVMTWWHDNVRPLLSSDLAGVRTDVTDLTTEFSGVATQPIIGTATGNVAHRSAPNNVALVASLRTASRGRSFRGRSYVAGIPDTMVFSPGEADESFRSALETAYNLLLDPTNFGDCVLGVLTSRAGGAPRAERFTTDVTGITVDKYFDSQRRRLVGRGA